MISNKSRYGHHYYSFFIIQLSLFIKGALQFILQRALCALFRYVCVIGDMLRAVAVVTLAPGAVAELQVREIHICAAADGALVGVRGLWLGVGGLVASGGIEGDGLALGMGGFFHSAIGIDPPGYGQQVQAVLAKGQEVVAQRDDREKVVGEKVEQTKDDEEQIKQGQVSGLYGDDEEQGELGIRVKGRIGQEQAQVQIVGVG